MDLSLALGLVPSAICEGTEHLCDQGNYLPPPSNYQFQDHPQVPLIFHPIGSILKFLIISIVFTSAYCNI